MIQIKPQVLISFLISTLILLICPFRFIQALAISFDILIILSFLYAQIISHNLKIERATQETRLARNETADITFTIKNYSRLPIFVCFLQDDVSTMYVYNGKNRQITSLAPRELKLVSYTILAQERGEFFAGPLKIKASDPLCLFQIEQDIQNRSRIIVRPTRIPLELITRPGLPQGSIAINNPCYEDISLHKNLRNYIPGDEVRRINWRASAKAGTLFTNEYDATYDVPVFIFLNLAEDDYPFDHRFSEIERAVEIAACIVEQAAKLKQRCGFAAYGAGFPFLKPAKNQTDYILDILAVIKPEKGHLPYTPYRMFSEKLPPATQFLYIGQKEAQLYEDKLIAGTKNINTKTLGIIKKNADTI